MGREKGKEMGKTSQRSKSRKGGPHTQKASILYYLCNINKKTVKKQSRKKLQELKAKTRRKKRQKHKELIS